MWFKCDIVNMIKLFHNNLHYTKTAQVEWKSTTMWVYFKDVRPWFLHDMGQAEQMKKSFSHETFPVTVSTQGLTDLGLGGFSCYLFTHSLTTVRQT